MSACPYSSRGDDEVDARPRAERASEWTPEQNETFGSAHHQYTELRETRPFPWSEEFGGFWAATTYEDVAWITQITVPTGPAK